MAKSKKNISGKNLEIYLEKNLEIYLEKKSRNISGDKSKKLLKLKKLKKKIKEIKEFLTSQKTMLWKSFHKPTHTFWPLNSLDELSRHLNSRRYNKVDRTAI